MGSYAEMQARKKQLERELSAGNPNAGSPTKAQDIRERANWYYEQLKTTGDVPHLLERPPEPISPPLEQRSTPPAPAARRVPARPTGRGAGHAGDGSKWRDIAAMALKNPKRIRPIS